MSSHAVHKTAMPQWLVILSICYVLLSVHAAAAESGEAELPHSYMKCVGGAIEDRACHFQNIYWDTKTRTFQVFTNELFKQSLHLTPGQEIQGKQSLPTEPWLQLSRASWRREKDPSNQFRVLWHTSGPLPAYSEVCRVTEPMHLRTPTSSNSFGHLLRDNFQGLLEMPTKLGQDPTQYSWVRWPSSSPLTRGYSIPTGVMSHYHSWLTMGRSLSWDELLQECQNRTNRGSRKMRYLRFDNLVAGWGGCNFKPKDGFVGPGACAPERWQMMRKVAYGMHDIAHKPVKDQEQVRLLMLEHTAHETRAMLNSANITEALRRRFPDVHVEAVQMSRMNEVEQLRKLSDTSIFVSNVGSASFRMLYLPDGAQVVLVGTPEGKVPLDGKEYNLAPFMEVDACWGHVGYFDVLRYKLQGDDQYFLASGREHLKATATDVYNFMRIWDADVIVDEAALGDLVQVALDQIAKAKASNKQQ